MQALAAHPACAPARRARDRACFATYTLYRSAEDHYIGVVLPLRGLTRDVLFQMEREESGVRGYMITKDRDSLEPYFAGRKGVLDGPRPDHGAHARSRAACASSLATVDARRVALHGFYDRLIMFVADGKGGQKLAPARRAQGHGSRGALPPIGLAHAGRHRPVQAATREQQRTTLHRTLAVLIIAGLLALAVAAALLVEVPERLRRLYALGGRGAAARGGGSERGARARARVGRRAPRRRRRA